MGILLTVFGIACLIYFGFLAAVSMDFGIVWLAAGLLFTGMGVFWRRLGKLLPRGVKIALWILAGLCILVFLAVETLIVSGMLEKGRPDLDCIVVLGAQVRGTTPSRALTKRLEEAQRYLEENPGTRAILSGGQGDGEEVTEAEAMETWLVAHGIDRERLILEDRSVSTEENLRFGAELLEPEKDSVGIVTNNFHVYRAVRLAKKQGYGDVCGIAAASDPRYQLHYMVREFFALVKEKMKGNI